MERHNTISVIERRLKGLNTISLRCFNRWSSFLAFLISTFNSVHLLALWMLIKIAENTIAKNPQTSNRPQQRPASKEPNQQPSRRTCWNCDTPDHRRKKCPYPKNYGKAKAVSAVAEPANSSKRVWGIKKEIEEWNKESKIYIYIIIMQITHEKVKIIFCVACFTKVGLRQ